MAKDLLVLLPTMIVLYVTFLLGQINQRRKNEEKRDVRPIIKAARHVIASSQLNEFGVPGHIAVQELELALDDWDLKAK